MTVDKPLFKWTGGKTKMRQLYEPHFWPERTFTRFIDAFYGGGSMSHWVLERFPNTEFVINDQNRELVQMYEVIRDHPDDFLAECQRLEEPYLQMPPLVNNDPTRKSSERHRYYTRVKMDYIERWESMGKIKESAYLYFMMKTSFNGWWKVYGYSRGRYSTAPGLLDETRPVIDPQLVRQHSDFYRERCVLLQGDFAGVQPYIDHNTYLYLDPPYRDSTTEYTEQGFTDSEQIRLCELYKYADGLGACVSLSNKEIGDGFFEQHLGRYEILQYDVKYTAAQGEKLTQAKEVLVRNFTSFVPGNGLFEF